MTLPGEAAPSGGEGDDEDEAGAGAAGAGAAAAGAGGDGPTLRGHRAGTRIRVQDAVHALAPARLAVFFMHLLSDAAGVPLEPGAFAAGMGPHRGALTAALGGRDVGVPGDAALTPATLFSALCGHFADGLARARAACSARGWLPAPEAQRNEATPLAPAAARAAPQQAAVGGGARGTKALTAAEAQAMDYAAYA